ncbi:MAG: sensor histidine kinase [Alteromonadaceae bacterium]|jgi:two-component system sensor histidine kinase GlrK|uniref:histidine kinase n=2 Tax=Paraglaciecola mesophila TaxID=197222 RepID=K6XZA1_9ALTE|nr:HAMP domain-containing sensor histidine kinase [Paraglaciecola mesophila]MAD14470.1 sensor histidine kinase [Alteromonadaceae bacterium]GAC25924.1 two-component system, NtrC family, sensor histidine kinase YfhK [Paraglaciecola mesophila KMM 241]|tara:strand:- start:3287 stop:4690 length:1404 start_codon:yes stop_codon:yes gene_type:complete
MQLGSLRQLTLVSFALVLVPLVVLLWHSQITLGRMGEIATNEAEFSVAMVRRVNNLESFSVDIERLIRQYHVLDKPELKELSDKYVQRFTESLGSLCVKLENSQECNVLSDRLTWFRSYDRLSDQLLLDAQLAEFRRALTELGASVDSLLDDRIKQRQAYVSSVQQTQAWLTALLVSISLILIIFGSQLILRPVRKLEHVIQAISLQEDELPEISNSGPKELILVERKLHRLSDRLTQLEHLRHALLRHASHELKTPLASIKEGCSLLTEQVVGELNDRQMEVMSLLNSSTDRLNTLIMQLLDYNLLLQQAKPDFQWLKTSALMEDFITDNRLALQQNKHELETKIELPQVYADAHLFRRILDNLLSNAIAHGSKGRPINIKLYQEKHVQVLDVSNRGQKISPEQRAILFEPFNRGEGKRNDRIIGSGLGLSIVADCARMMRGKVEIVDVDYADVCFRVSIPLTEKK